MLVSFMAKSATETKGLIVWGTKSHCMQLKRLFEILATFFVANKLAILFAEIKISGAPNELAFALLIKNEHVPAKKIFQRHGSQRQPCQPGCPNSYMPELFESL